MTTASNVRLSPARRWLIGAAVALVLALTLLAFGLSYSVLQDLAARSGIPAEVTWAWPLIVDGTIVVTMVVIFAQRGRGRRANALPWTALVIFALVSVVGNGIHTAAVHDASQGISMAIAIGVGAVPPIALLVASEMLVRLLAPQGDTVVVANNIPADLDVVPEPVPAAEIVTEVTSDAKAIEQSVSEVAPEGSDTAEPPAESVPDTAVNVEPLPEANALDVIRPEPSDEPVFEAEANVESTEVESEPKAEPVARLHAVEKTQQPAETIPTDKGDQIDWVIARARAGEEVTRERLAERLGVSVRTAQRRLAEARELAPEAFAVLTETEELQKVS